MLSDAAISEQARPTSAPAPSATQAVPNTALSGQQARHGEYLSFKISDEEYALDILNVQEIRSYEPPTRIAGAGPCIKGVVNLRGVIVPIVDLRLALGVQAPSYDALTVVIVLNVLKCIVGVVVDSVSDVVELAAEQIQPAPELHGSSSDDFISGIATLALPTSGGAPRERLLILTDVARMLGTTAIGLTDADFQPH
jgi:purine-binding chemotaxis protein CheW